MHYTQLTSGQRYQIEALLKAKTPKKKVISLSHERIYQHAWADKRQGGELYTHLRQSNKRRKKKYGSQDKRGQIRNRVSIDARPECVAQKERIGDWEIDLVMGQHHQGALVTIVERRTKFTLIEVTH